MASPASGSGEGSAPDPTPANDSNSSPDPAPIPLSDNIPELTFGLEIELNLAVRKWMYKAWIKNAIPSDADNPNDYPANLNAATLQARDEHMSILQRRDQEYRDALAALPTPPLALSIPEPNIPPSPTRTSKQSESTQDTHSSEDVLERLKLLGYLRAYLSHATRYNEMASYKRRQHLTKRDRDLVPQLLITKLEAHRYRVLGAELVSAVLNFDDMRSWYAQLQQLNTDLTFDENRNQGAWFGGETHIHVHFVIKDDTISLDVAKNVCILYGIFETEIESWLPISQRYSNWCKQLRRGMEKERLAYTDDKKDIQLLPGLRYTPSLFADMCYAATNMQELKTKISGWSCGEWVGPISGYGIGAVGEPSMSVGNSSTNTGATVGLRNWVSVNLSLARDNKPFTIEFRHHHGTMDPETIAWWVRFLGKLVRFAYYLAQNDVRIKHTGHFTQDSFVDDLPNQSILDLIGFPAEGIAHFRQMRDSYLDPEHLNHQQAMDWQNARTREQHLIDWRIQKRKEGEDTGKEMDDNYYREQTRIRTGVLPSDTTLNHPRFGVVPGEEPVNPVPLRGQALVDRMVRIVFNHIHGGDEDKARALAAIAHSDPGGLDYTQQQGLDNLEKVLNNSGTGLLEIWKDALAAILMSKRGRRESFELWENMILTSYVPEWVIDRRSP
ncbi:uncharacterized protein PAC_03556 [Phialocephala subalpina]|uniref:Uncharacterized protein n=1 Tax=Phialocephala subalpina TaxID=576137 RepID=A0A1L7WLP2_9HELO|nr:uncharacterized protein PAC_03556 [Phialocephala subalpina]